jgi:hypothetical protein
MKMELSIWENGRNCLLRILGTKKLGKEMDKGFRFGQMVQNTLAIGNVIKQMAEEDLFMQMEMSMMV